jgi:hypothetical protein
VGNLFSAKGHLDIYNIISGPYTITNLKINLLYLVKHLINSPLMWWLEVLLFGEACDVSRYWWCCYSQLRFQVCVGQSGAQSTLCDAKYWKELLAAVSCSERRCIFQCMSPQSRKFIIAYVTFTELKQWEIVVSSLQLIIALHLNDFVM